MTDASPDKLLGSPTETELPSSQIMHPPPKQGLPVFRREGMYFDAKSRITRYDIVKTGEEVTSAGMNEDTCMRLQPDVAASNPPRKHG